MPSKDSKNSKNSKEEKKKHGRPAFRSELSINDIRALAWNATEGDPMALQILKEQNKMLAKIANTRMRQLKSAKLDMFAYDRAITYLDTQGLSRFSLTLQDPTDFEGIVKQLSEVTSFVNAKTSTLAGAKKALDEKLDKISEFTGTTYTDQQRYNLGRLLGTDSVSTLLRDVRGDSGEVLEILEDLSRFDLESNQNENAKEIQKVIDRYLAGWQPWDNTASWLTRSRGMNYDELMDELREIKDAWQNNT